jgi:hypothetical protein
MVRLEDYRNVPGNWSDARSRAWNPVWGYIDVRDVAYACRLAIDCPAIGAESFIIAAADTIMSRPSAELLREAFPSVTQTRDIGTFETLLAVNRAVTCSASSPSTRGATKSVDEALDAGAGLSRGKCG